MYKFGVDVGGTTVKMGLFDEQGTLLEKFEIPTDKTEDGSHIIEQITKRLNQAMEEHDLTVEECMGVGVGLPGPVDEQGNILGCVNLGWGVFPVEKAFAEQFHGLPVKAANDANVAALGEQTAGAAKGRRNVVMVTLGTGVGGGIIIDGKILTGANGGAGEIGHIKLQMNGGPICGCGDTGCLEAFASGPSIVAMAEEYIKGGKSTKFREMANGGQITPYIVCEAAKAGDPVAQRIFNIMGEYIGIGLSSVVNLLNPEKIIIGGGVADAGDLLLAPLTETLKKRAMKIAGSAVEVVPAQLGNTAGVIGASLLIES